MGKQILKRYGRPQPNKLDWLLAIAACVFALSSLWISLGISMANAAQSSIEAFSTFVRGLCFNFDVSYGQSAIVSVVTAVLVYLPLLTLIVCTIYYSTKKIKGRIAGLYALLVASVGFALFLCFTYEFAQGHAAGVLNEFWPYSLIFFLVLFGCLIITACVLTLNQNSYLEFVCEEAEEPVLEETKEDEQPEEVTEAVVEEKEPIVESEPEEEIVKETAEEVVEEAVEEEQPEEVEEESSLEDEEELSEEEEVLVEEGEDNPFAGLGKRRKRIPFENKVKRAKPEVTTRYRLIVSALREYGFNDRKSIPCETFSYKKEKMVILTFSGQTLKAYFRLNASDYVDSTIPLKDAEGIKKYEDTPSYLIIKSDLAARRVIQLAERIIQEHNIPKK